MQQQQQQYQTYYTHYYPFELITRFITCNRPDTLSPQYRDLRFECKRWVSPHFFHAQQQQQRKESDLMSKKYFDRRTPQLLRAQVMKELPQSIHIGSLVPLQLDQSQFVVTPQQQQQPRRKRISLAEEGLGATTTTTMGQPDWVSPLHETDYAGSDHIHFMTAVEKELAFDIDVPEFDRFCECCDTRSGGGGTEETRRMLCDTCWLHIEGAYFIVLFLLTKQLGYERHNVMCVFSGGKGLHFFVNDRRAMQLDEAQRLFIHDTLAIPNGVKERGDSQLFTWILRDTNQALSERLEQLFHDNVLVRRDLLAGHESPFRRWVLNKLYRHYPAVHNQVQRRWDAMTGSNSVDLWQVLKKFEVYRERSGEARADVRPSLFLIYRLYYPMIDKSPMKMSHSVKLPFSVHSKTGNVALPVSDEFITANDKLSQLVSLDTLTATGSRVQQKRVPPLFARGTTILDEWLGHY
jgi:DNA primase catalytic subunit